MSNFLGSYQQDYFTAQSRGCSSRFVAGFFAMDGKMAWWFWGRKKKAGPRYEVKPLLAQHKAKFFVRLCKAVPTFYIFPQVLLSSLLTPTAEDHKGRKADNEKIAGLAVDYAIYNADLTLVCIVFLNDGSSDPDSDAIMDHCLKNAGVKTIRWDVETSPTVEQIRRTMLPSINKAMASPDAANKAAFESELTIQAATLQATTFQATTRFGGMEQDSPPDTLLMIRQADPTPSNIKGLSPAMLDQLTPHKVLQKNYPHIWQRICAFAGEPKHLKKYLLSLSMQDRNEKRAGFPLEALKEIADIQSQNDRFLMEGMRTWQPGFINP